MHSKIDRVSNVVYMKNKAENEQAFERIFNALYLPLCIYVSSIVHDKNEAEDIVQQVFVQLWEKNQDLEWDLGLKPYLYRCVHNAALNHIRQEAVRSRFFEFLQMQEIDYGDGEEREEMEKLYRRLDEAIAGMPEQMREVFLLSRFSGKTSAEIAEQLNLSVRTVENHIYRGMKYLREELQGDSRDEMLLLFLLF